MSVQTFRPQDPQLYARGRDLIASGLRMADLVWDADEVLWLWAMSGIRLYGRIPWAIAGQLGHREYITFIPGIADFLYGLHDASREAGHDPYLRIWTNGYPWRLWKILRRAPHFEALLGAPHCLDTDDSRVMAEHPRVFTRVDYVRVAQTLIDPIVRRERLAAFPEPARSAILRQLDLNPFNSAYKIPELALLAGKEAFRSSHILIDDAASNVQHFHRTGRSAVHVPSLAPRITFGKIPNSAWRPQRVLRQQGHDHVNAIADALETLITTPEPTIVPATLPPEPTPGPPNPLFHLDVPSAILAKEWLGPMRQLRRIWKAN